MESNNKYTNMQRDQYNKTHLEMQVENHRFHDNNPDYINLLFKDIVENSLKYSNCRVFEFGVGCGRNLDNISKLTTWAEIGGCDISHKNIEYSEKYLENINSNIKLYVSSGTDIGTQRKNYYDFIFSTIVLQHICVHEIRFNILKCIYQSLKPGGEFSFQMGYDGDTKITGDVTIHPEQIRPANYATVKYSENYYNANKTNSYCDTRVDDENELLDDLKKIGFKLIEYNIRPPWCDDKHKNWIYVRVTK
jgi:SAM-dependent methyltransferase